MKSWVRLPALGAVLLLLAACQPRRLSEADCALVEDRLQRAWQRDAVAAVRLSERKGMGQFIRDEGHRIGRGWMGACEPLVGREVSDDELRCLAAVDTIDDVYECAPR